MLFLSLTYLLFMLQIDYPEVHANKSNVRGGCNVMNLDRLPQQYDPQDELRMKRLNVDSTTFNDQVSIQSYKTMHSQMN